MPAEVVFINSIKIGTDYKTTGRLYQLVTSIKPIRGL